jgi:hypothetical protein
LRDGRVRNGRVTFRFDAKQAFFIRPVGPLRLTVGFGSDAAASGAGECGSHTFVPAACVNSASGDAYVCK